MRKATVFVLVALLFLGADAGAAGLIARMRGKDTGNRGMFPEDEAVPGLKREGKVLTYKGKTFENHYGTAGNRYLQYGLANLKAADYILGGEDKRVVIEIATMDSVNAAAGLFHAYRSGVMKSKGQDIDVGMEGVLDSERGGRNVYFYKSNLFVKIVYSGRMPIPDLVPLARVVDAEIPAGRNTKPDGLKYIDVEGVDMSTVAITPGYTFSSNFLPPSVWANAAAAGGSTATDLFIITRANSREAAQVAKDYTSYMRLASENYEQYKRGKLSFTKGTDPVQGRVIFTSYKNAVIIVARPDGFERGEALIDRVIAKIDADG